MINQTLTYLIAFLFILIGNSTFAQATPNPCDFANVECGVAERNGFIYSFDSDTIVYAPVGRSMPFWFAVGDTSTGVIDTISNCDFVLHKITGPGEIAGWGAFTEAGKYAYYDSVYFSEQGIYTYHINDDLSALYDTIYFVVPPEKNFCEEVPGGDCVKGGGDKIYARAHSGIIVPVDAVLPVTAGVVNSLTELLDSTYAGTIYVEKVFGPGFIYGSLSVTGEKWFPFNNLRFSAEGDYQIKFYELDSLDITEGYLDVEVIGTNSIAPVSFSDLTFYPNPFNNSIHISTNQVVNETVVKIHNFQGQLMFEQKLNSLSNDFTLNTDFLKDGIYFISVEKQGIIIDTGKIVKTK